MLFTKPSLTTAPAAFIARSIEKTEKTLQVVEDAKKSFSRSLFEICIESKESLDQIAPCLKDMDGHLNSIHDFFNNLHTLQTDRNRLTPVANEAFTNFLSLTETIYSFLTTLNTTIKIYYPKNERNCFSLMCSTKEDSTNLKTYARFTPAADSSFVKTGQFTADRKLQDNAIYFVVSLLIPCGLLLGGLILGLNNGFDKPIPIVLNGSSFISFIFFTALYFYSTVKYQHYMKGGRVEIIRDKIEDLLAIYDELIAFIETGFTNVFSAKPQKAAYFESRWPEGEIDERVVLIPRNHQLDMA